MPGKKALLFFALLLAARLAGQNCADTGVRIRESRRGDVIRLYAETTNCTDTTVTLTVQLENMRASQRFPLTLETKGRASVEIVTLVPADAGKAWRYSYNYRWFYGGRGGRPDATVYQLPFEAGVSHVLIQGYGGSFSHQAGTLNEYAQDWDLAEGSLVLAAREGIVVGIRQDSGSGGVAEQFKGCANYVIIRHPDGTYAEYLHLKQNSVLVKMGEPVAAGHPLALSGNTGYSSRPHLHFAVFRTIDGSHRESLPVKFKTAQGQGETLREGRTY